MTFKISNIINQHQALISNSSYLIVDPNEQLNKLLSVQKSQDELIKYYQENTHDVNGLLISYIDILYNQTYLVRFIVSNVKIVISSLNPESAHLIRIIGNMKIPNYLSELKLDIEIDNEYLSDILFEIGQLITNAESEPMDHCTVCGKNLQVKGIKKIKTCSNTLCKITEKNLITDNKITDLNKKDPIVCEFLIQTMIIGSTHPKQDKIFKPVPILLGVNNFIQFKQLLDEEVRKNNVKYENITSSSNDVELYKKIGSSAYGLITSAISDNYFSMNVVQKFSTEVLLTGEKSNETPRLYMNQNSQGIESTIDKLKVFDSDDIKFIGFNYSHEIESVFKKEHFLFHGSPMHCWYPIIKNGLKVMSGTEFMTTGAAYGNGIYFSDDFGFSLGYAGKFNNSSNETKSVVGIFEIRGGIEQHKKASNIYVINDDKIILLRYLVVASKNFNNYQAISDYFFKYLGGINKLNEKKTTNIKNKRFGAEMKLLASNSKVEDIIMINESTHWEIKLKNIKTYSVKLNVYFNDYPKFPPKITLESSENFNFIHDQSNNVILPELQLNGWEVTNNLSKIIDNIYNCICSNI